MSFNVFCITLRVPLTSLHFNHLKNETLKVTLGSSSLLFKCLPVFGPAKFTLRVLGVQETRLTKGLFYCHFAQMHKSYLLQIAWMSYKAVFQTAGKG